MREITFTLPLPPKACKPGSRGHWATRARAAKSYRQAGKIACLCGMGKERPRFEKAEIEYDFYLARIPGADAYHPRDDDNARAAMKAAQDGFTDAGIFLADDAKRVKVTAVRLYSTAKEHQGKAEVRVTIREAA